MKLIVGLGNPGRAYATTRHNVGWIALDYLADVWHCDAWRRDGDSLISETRRSGTRIRLLKPQTFMNLSGSALRPYKRRETWDPAQDLMVVVDDIAIPLGTLRMRAAGSAGGHNGLKSVEAALGTLAYPRLRIGILPADERRRGDDLADFVLQAFGRDERAVLDEVLPRLRTAMERWLESGVEPAMRIANVRPAASEESSD